MADSKLSGLPQARTIGPNDKFYVVAAGTSSYITGSDLATQVSGQGADYYGMIIHQDVANPNERVEYIGINANFTPMSMNLATGACNYGSWGSMPTIVKNVPAMVRTNGTLDYYLNPNDYTKKLDGATASDVANTSYDGNALAWFEPIWMSVKAEGNDLEVRFAYSKLDNSYIEVCPSGCGVWLPMFYGSPINGHMRSIANTSVLGGVSGNNTTDAQKNSITANGSNYLFFGGKLAMAITLLQYMWFKTTNSGNIARGNQDGYNSSDTSTYGTKANPVIGGGQFFGTADGRSANKVLHCLPLATYDIWLRDPYVLTVNGQYKVSEDYSYDVSGATYTATGILAPTTNGYTKTLAVVDGFGLLPKEVGGSNSTYYSDNFWINTTITAVSLLFGSCGSGRDDGLYARSCHAAAGNSHWSIGCALILKQPR